MPAKKQPVTIKSISAALNLSFSTVAKALNNDPKIALATRQLVQETARKMNYTRNYFAQNMRQASSKTVAIILNDIEIPAYSDMVTTISGQLAARGYTTMIIDSQYSEEFERSSIETMLSRQPEVVLIAPIDPAGANLQLLKPMFSNTLVLGDPEGLDVNAVIIDHRLAGLLSARHMLNHGSTDNLIFAGPVGYQPGIQYLEGIREAYREQNMTLSEDVIFRFKPDMQTAYRQFMSLWQEHPHRCGGVLCLCDSIALGIYAAARELGLEIGKDLSVIGYDDCPTNDFTAPPMTTIHLPKDQVAACCTEFVIRRLTKPDEQLQTYHLKPYLVDRASVNKKKA